VFGKFNKLKKVEKFTGTVCLKGCTIFIEKIKKLKRIKSSIKNKGRMGKF
jgi:hypothetical protein